MAISTEHRTAYRDASLARAGEDPVTAWFRPRRDAALARFLAHGFPTTREEDWHYTDLGDLDRRAAELLTLQGSAASQPASGGIALNAGELTLALINGIFSATHAPANLPAGLRVRHLRDLGGESVAGAATGETSTALDDMNTAFLADVLVLEVDAGVRVAQPVCIAVINDTTGVFANRIELSLGHGAALTLIEHHCGGTAAISNVVTTVQCDQDSELDYIRLQQDGIGSTHLASQSFRLAAGAHARLASLDLGASLARADLQVNLAGTGSRVDVHGLILADGSRHVDNHTRFDHHGRNALSRATWHGIAAGKARGVFNGKILVHPGAAGTDAELRNANLLLSRDAEIDTKPELEIYTDEVKCSHGATTGQLDEQAIFYLRSRGISLAEARRLLIEAFALEIRRGIRSEPLRSAISAILAGRLNTLGIADNLA